MNTLYELHQHDGLQIDSLTDESAGLRIQVNRHGAELISIARRASNGNWTGFLYRDADTSTPPDGWKNHATLMGYYIHRLLDEQSAYRGHTIRGGTHSFLRHKDFAPPAVDTIHGALTYTIGPADYTPEEYPFKVQLTLTYTLLPSPDNPQLQVTFDFQNIEPAQSSHVSFGLHPGFALHSLAQGQVLLPPGAYIRHMAPGNFLSGETIRIDHPGGPMPFPKADLPGSFILGLAHVPDPIFIVEDPAAHRRTVLDYRQAPYLTLWSDGHAFICVEPCWGLPDHQAQRPFDQKEGIQEIPPAARITHSFTIQPQLMD
jgi:galactose mutarotase-like enzyme